MTFIPFEIIPEEVPQSDRASVVVPGPRRDHGRRIGRSIATTLSMWWRRRRSRERLADLSEHLLKDIGITRAEAEHEANKPFWLP